MRFGLKPVLLLETLQVTLRFSDLKSYTSHRLPQFTYVVYQIDSHVSSRLILTVYPLNETYIRRWFELRYLPPRDDVVDDMIRRIELLRK